MCSYWNLGTMADIAASAHLSIVDYFGEIPWGNYPLVKEWYALMKSRPAFRPVLEDRVAGFAPPSHYANPDF